MATQDERSFMYHQSNDLHPMVYVIAIIVSILIHMALVYFAGDNAVKFTHSVDASVQQRLALRKESAMTVEMNDADPEMPFEATNEPIQDPYEVEMEDLLVSVPTSTSGATFEPPAAAAELNASLGAKIQSPAVAERVEPPMTWKPREELIAMVDKVVYDEIVPYERRDIPNIERKHFAPDVTLPFELQAGLNDAKTIGTPTYVNPAPPKVDALSVAKTISNEEAKMPDTIEAGPVASGKEAATFFREIPAEVAPAKPIEDVLKTSMTVYRPRRSDGYAYFRIDIERKTADVLPPLPRDVLLVQDASASLGRDRLHFCKKAFLDIIDTLEPTDRVNVLQFNAQSSYCFGNSWQPANASNKQRAKAFVDAIESSGSTDFFNAVKGVLSLPRSDERPMIVILASDGRATSGNLQRDSEIIGEFTRLSNGQVSVFNIGVSKSSNEFLLSMLSMGNRGDKAILSSDRFTIPKVMMRLFSTLKNPVLTDTRFMFDYGSKADVVPKTTTYLYLDRPMQLFGRIPEGEQEVTFQARGVSRGEQYDMVFNMDLAQATPGDEDLATAWATAKMYDYVGEHARNPSVWVLSEMNALGRQYDIPIPFKDKLF